MRPDQMVEEFKGCMALAKHCLETLGVEEDVTYHLSKWDPDNKEKYIGEPEVWEETQEHIRQILTELNIPFVEDVGEAAFYGPKVDINAKNVYGKEDTMITIQWDALLAEQFDMYYIDETGKRNVPALFTEPLWAATRERWHGSLKNMPVCSLPGCVRSKFAYCRFLKNTVNMQKKYRHS